MRAAVDTPLRNQKYGRAITDALAEEMARDERVFVMGQDVGAHGGVFRVTKGLLEQFGPDRVRDTAIVETFLVGAAAGAAITGLRPVVELQFADFLLVAADELFNRLPKWRYMHGGQTRMPVVVRLPTGISGGAGPEHSQSLEAMAMHVPGLRVAVPATPADAKGLLKSAIRDDNPVLFFEHKALYFTSGPVPNGPEELVPFGRAEVRRPGTDCTVVAYGLMVPRCLEAAEALAVRGVSAEVIDLRTLAPLDIDTALGSVERTARAVVVHEACRTGGAGAEIAALIQERAFYSLDAPVARIAGADLPIPQNPALEQHCIPSVEGIVARVEALVRR
jgi:pyruvate/2-oxoglutarate/acetoin dehydrogenase E1 component